MPMLNSIFFLHSGLKRSRFAFFQITGMISIMHRIVFSTNDFEIFPLLVSKLWLFHTLLSSKGVDCFIRCINAIRPLFYFILIIIAHQKSAFNTNIGIFLYIFLFPDWQAIVAICQHVYRNSSLSLKFIPLFHNLIFIFAFSTNKRASDQFRCPFIAYHLYDVLYFSWCHQAVEDPELFY